VYGRKAVVRDRLLMADIPRSQGYILRRLAGGKPPFVTPGGLAGLGALPLFQARFGRFVAGSGRQEAGESSGTSFIEISNMSERQAGV
jgi:hypothetical protein